jgi:hypothetical protein
MKPNVVIAFAAGVVAGGCSGPATTESNGSSASAIVDGMPATAYPEAVIVNSGSSNQCSGAVLAPRVVITAGHCLTPGSTYQVIAPNAGNQQVTASEDYTTYTGDPTTSSDTLLLFLDTPIALANYPVVPSQPVAPYTTVVDIGRTLNGSITMTDYVSPPVTILGPATSLGFPFNYEAQPDISQGGDSGGPIELLEPAGSSAPHTIVAIVDLDTSGECISQVVPTDLFARLDLVYADIEAQIAMHGGSGGSPVTPTDGGPGLDASPEGSPVAPTDGAPGQPMVEPSGEGGIAQGGKGFSGGSGCSTARGAGAETGAGQGGLAAVVALLLAVAARARRR